MKRAVAGITLLVMVAFIVIAGAQNEVQRPGAEPPALGIIWERGVIHPARPGGGGSPDMTWHNGQILTSSETAVIFWGANWSNSSFVADKVTGLDQWYAGYGGSNYAKTTTEYTGTNGTVGSGSTYTGHYIDTTASKGGNNTSAILAEVCKMIPSPKANGFYAVYVDQKRSGNYCAYHSYGSCGSTPVQFGFFWNLDGDAGCDPQDTSGLHSQGLAALANVSGHELAETVTDPRNGGWYDSGGAENGDKCAWTFGAPLVTLGSTQWKIQGEWSNHAFDTNTGYPNRSGQNGCLSGK